MTSDLDLPLSAARARLRDLICELSLRFGEFVLASGAKSDHYVDLRRTTTHPEGALLSARLLLDRIPPSIHAIGGPTLGADPILGALAVVGQLRGTPRSVFIVRKAAKTHGAGRQIEGHLEPGQHVAVLDDVVTGGGSIMVAIDAAVRAGAIVDRVLCIVDRRAGRGGPLADAGFELDALFTIEEILDAARA